MLCSWRKYAGKTLSLFANSYGLDVGASTPSEGANAMLVAALGVAADNRSISGAMVPDLASAAYSKAVTGEGFSKVLFGVNEHWFYAPHSVPLYEYFGSALAAMLGYLAIPNGANKIFPVGGGAVETGTWSNTPVYGKGRKSTVSGSTMSATVFGNAVLINYIVQDGCLGEFNLKVDAIDYGNFNCFLSSPMATNLGASYGPASILVDGLDDGAHEVEITIISPTAPAAAVYIDMIAGMGGDSCGCVPLVMTANCPRMSDAAYASLNSSDGNVIRLNQIILEAVHRLKSLGADIRLADYYSIERSHLDNTGAHFGNEGQRLMCLADQRALDA